MNPNSVPLPTITQNNLNSKLRLLVLLNPGSGNKQEGNISQTLQQQLVDYEFEILTVGDGIEEQLTRTLKTFKPDRVIAAGGDGTINLAAKHLQGKDIELAVLPTGSANGMARELNLPTDIDEAIQIALHGKVMPIDILCLNGEHFCLHLSDIGLNAKVVKRFEVSGKRGMWGYVVQFANELWNNYTSHFTIEAPDGQIIRAKAYMVVAANASRYGTGAVINPDAKLDDGLFELCIFKRMPFRGMIRLAFAMWVGNVKLHPWTDVKTFDEVTIINHDKCMVQTDGEVLGKLPRLHVKAFKQALKVVVPNAENTQKERPV